MLRLVRQFSTYFSSHIRFKIIFPFAFLTLMIALIGIYLSTHLVAGSLEERFTRQLIEAGSAASDGLGQRERSQLSALRAIAFTEGINQAILTDNQEELRTLLFPLIANYDIDRVDVVSASGRQLLEIHRPPGARGVEDYMTSSDTELTGWAIWPGIQKALSGVVDTQGDKYVALGSINGRYMFQTVGPVKLGNNIVGAIVVSSYTKDLLEALSQATFSEVSLYDLEGRLVDTTLHGDDQMLNALTIDPAEARAMLAVEGNSSLHQHLSLGDRQYDLLVGIFEARGAPLGFYSVGLQNTFITLYGVNARNQMAVIFAIALLLVLGMGYTVANRITGRVQHLMENAMAVASGDFTRRTNISSADEIGWLARSLDDMTESLATYTSSLQNKINELIALHESSTAVTIKSGLNLEHILQAVTSSISGVIPGIDQAVVHLLDEKHQELVPRACTYGDVNRFPSLDYSYTGRLHDLLTATQPRVVNLSILASCPPNRPFLQNQATKVLVVPLMAGQQIVGMLTLIPNSIESEAAVLYEDKELLLGTLANQTAIAIKNAQLFEATQRAYEELRKLDDLKTQFINIAAHELRTPLGAMMGYASFVEKRVPPELHGSMRFLVASTIRMRTMVDAMLTIQRLDAGTTLLRLASVDVRDLLKKVVTDFKPMADLEGHIISVNLPDKLPAIVIDSEKVGLVLSNLISNAIKFTPEKGRIEITARDYLKGILVSVSDNGVGIPLEDQERIFERFYQVRAAHIAGHGGMGLGLTIVKHLVELHQGQVWVDSEPGQGTTFFFTLPNLAVDASAEADTLPQASLPLYNEQQIFVETP